MLEGPGKNNPPGGFLQEIRYGHVAHSVLRAATVCCFLSLATATAPLGWSLLPALQKLMKMSNFDLKMCENDGFSHLCTSKIDENE